MSDSSGIVVEHEHAHGQTNPKDPGFHNNQNQRGFRGQKRGRTNYHQNPKRIRTDVAVHRHNTDLNLPKPSTLLGFRKVDFIEIYCSNLGLEQLCQAVYDSFVRKEYRPENALNERTMLSFNCFTYIMHMVWINRMVQVATSVGNYIDEHNYYLREKIGNLEIPHMIADYIETFGKIQLATGAIVTPYFRSNKTVCPLPTDTFPWSTWKSRHPELNHPQWSTLFTDPRKFLFADGVERLTNSKPWSFNTDYVVTYSKVKHRFSKPSLPLRRVDCDNVMGKPHMLVTTVVQTDGDFIHGESPQEMLQEELKLGAVYRIRTGESQAWPGISQPLYNAYQGVPFDESNYLFSLVN